MCIESLSKWNANEKLRLSCHAALSLSQIDVLVATYEMFFSAQHIFMYHFEFVSVGVLRNMRMEAGGWPDVLYHHKCNHLLNKYVYINIHV